MLPTEKIRRGERQVVQLLLQRMHRRGGGATGRRLDRLRRLDHGCGDGGGARGCDDVADRPRRQDAVDGEERGGGRHGGGGGAGRGSRGDDRLAVPRHRLLRADRTPGERTLVRDIGGCLVLIVAPRRRRDVILRVRRVAVEIAVPVAGYTGTIRVQRTRRLRHGRA